MWGEMGRAKDGIRLQDEATEIGIFSDLIEKRFKLLAAFQEGEDIWLEINKS